jgi:4-hydroxy-3-methylbut-2-enyl diphosphate reductase
MSGRVVQRVLLASPRGYCAGVERAVQTVDRALDLYGTVYVRHEIVHNRHVVRELQDHGAVFVQNEREAPAGATLVLSAHGVEPEVHERCALLGQRTIDATCPLVTKVHVQARRFAAEGYGIVLIGHRGHEEVVGTMGEAPGTIVLAESVADAEALSFPAGAKLAYVTQTTLSVEETAEIIAVLRRRFPDIRSPKRRDICYATSNRQRAVQELLPQVQLLLVIGSENSSNSNRLVDVARAGGVDAHLIEDAAAIDESWFEQVEAVGVTSGASAPERLVEGVCDWFHRHGVEQIEQARIVEEHVEFRLPVELRRELRARDST